MATPVVVFAQCSKPGKGTDKFEEVKDATAPPSMSGLYLPKHVLAGMGNPAQIKVTIEPA